MKQLLQIILAAVFMTFIACGSDNASSNQQKTTDADSTATERGLEPANFENTSHNCPIAGDVLPGNQFWAKDVQILVAIVADSTTYDEDLDAPSHRILEIYNTADCSLIERKTLPVDVSPDFAYYIAEITYNKINKLVAIRGAKTIYCYDVESRKLLPKMTPKFRSERFGVDAQSGQIQRLEVWEDYLIGYAQDYGVFAFDFADKQNPKAVMPFAEYAISESEFAPLFLLTFEQGGTQAIMPEYSRQSGAFLIHATFDSPMNLNSNVPQSARNNRYLVLREQGSNNAIAFDLEQHEQIELPADMITKPTQEVLQWMRSNVQ